MSKTQPARRYRYIGESMWRIDFRLGNIRRLLILIMCTTLLTVSVATVRSQTTGSFETGLNEALKAVRRAEAAGATSQEIAQLVGPLNVALNLHEQALKLSGSNRTVGAQQMSAQIEAILQDVESRANQLTSVASSRTSMNTTKNYTLGVIAALIVTLAYACCISLWRKYRVKRTYQMRIIPK